MKLREQAYNNFTEKLLAKDLMPGQFVSQRELVEITQMPLGAIREMIPRLEADGLIITAPKRGLQIAHIDLNMIKNAFQFRLFLEKPAAELFARTAPETEFKRIRSAHEEILESATGTITETLIKRAQTVDWNLHETIIDALDNDIISNAYRVNFVKIRLIRQEQTSLNTQNITRAISEHMEIIDSFDRRDAEAAGRAITAHITTARARALNL
jgi:DNA-binding GntR family transcriptional regulator